MTAVLRAGLLLGMLVLGLSLGTMPGLASVPAAPTCAAGLSALRAGDIQHAQLLFSSIRPQNSPCVRQGLTAANALAQASSLNAVGLDAMADQDIQRALQAEPTLSIPADIMPATTGPQGQALAETLERDGYDAQAKQILLQVIEKDPRIQLDPQDQAILRQVGSSVESEIWHVIINPVFLAGFLIGLLVMLSLYSRLRRRLHFQPFDAGNDNDAGPGPAATLRELIRAEVHRLAAEARLADGRKLRLDQAGPYEADCDLGKVSDGMPDVWKPIVSVTGMIMKTIGSKARLVTGMLLPGGSVAMGMETVNGVVKHKSVIQNEELGFPPPDRDILAQLALPAAAWIILSYDPCARLGGTSQWESYVAFAAGYAWQEKGDMLRAKECYKRACNNPDNLAAAVNLAALEQREERQAQQVSPVDRQSYKRLSELVRNPYIPASDVQWYRSRYLLSTGLRDAWDRPDGGIAVVPEPGQRDAVYGEALRHAAELALELERKAAAPGSLPEPFVAYGRAAALTLVARQAVQTTSDLHKVVTDAAQVPEYDEVSVRNALGNVLAGKPDVGTAERLMTFVRWHLPVDDQAQYNMYRFHRTRAANLAATIAGWDSLLADAERTYGASPPNHVRKWERDIQLWREGLAELREDEMVQMKEFADQVVAAQDPILAERVTTLREADPEPAARRGGHHRDRGAEGRARLSELPPPTVPPPPVVPEEMFRRDDWLGSQAWAYRNDEAGADADAGTGEVGEDDRRPESADHETDDGGADEHGTGDGRLPDLPPASDLPIGRLPYGTFDELPQPGSLELPYADRRLSPGNGPDLDSGPDLPDSRGHELPGDAEPPGETEPAPASDRPLILSAEPFIPDAGTSGTEPPARTDGFPVDDYPDEPAT